MKPLPPRWRFVATVVLLFATTAEAEPAIDTRIRAEGLRHSNAMLVAKELTERIGARLTASPAHRRAVNWTAAELRHLGLAKVHVERSPPSMVPWRQRAAWMRSAGPGARNLTVIAAPWSSPSQGTRVGHAFWADIRTVADFDRFRGRLRGKVVFLGTPTEAGTRAVPLSHRIGADGFDAELAPLREYMAHRDNAARRLIGRTRFKRALGAFLTEEGIAALVTPSGAMAAADRGLITSDDATMPTPTPWQPGARLPFPVLIAARDDFRHIVDGARSGAGPDIIYRVDTEVGTTPRPVENVVADLPGGDPDVAGQIVLIGAHLDSWIGGTGATDNAAGVAIVIEAIRILRQLDERPRRTIRVVLYGGEEQGLLGSRAYARRHLGTVPRVDDADQRDIMVEGWRQPAGPPRLLPAHAQLSVAFNVDGGTGRIRGVFTDNNPALAAVVRQWIAPLADLGVDRVLDEPTWPADQSSFSDLGLPTIDVAQDPLDYDTRTHHTTMDRFDRLSADDLAQAATVLATMLWKAANAATLMPRSTTSGGVAR